MKYQTKWKSMKAVEKYDIKTRKKKDNVNRMCQWAKFALICCAVWLLCCCCVEYPTLFNFVCFLIVLAVVNFVIVAVFIYSSRSIVNSNAAQSSCVYDADDTTIMSEANELTWRWLGRQKCTHTRQTHGAAAQNVKKAEGNEIN